MAGGISYLELNVVLNPPKAPVKPYLKQNHTVEDVSEYGVKLAEYTGVLVTYEEEKNRVREYNHKVHELTHAFIRNSSGIDDVMDKNTADVLFKYFEKISEDYYELANHLNEFVDTFHEVKRKV
jgi:hypothetical protein